MWSAFLAMNKKPTDRTRNWSEYNRALKQPGSLTVWIGFSVMQDTKAAKRPNSLRLFTLRDECG